MTYTRTVECLEKIVEELQRLSNGKDVDHDGLRRAVELAAHELEPPWGSYLGLRTRVDSIHRFVTGGLAAVRPGDPDEQFIREVERRLKNALDPSTGGPE